MSDSAISLRAEAVMERLAKQHQLTAEFFHKAVVMARDTGLSKEQIGWLQNAGAVETRCAMFLIWELIGSKEKFHA